LKKRKRKYHDLYIVFPDIFCLFFNTFKTKNLMHLKKET